IISQALFVRCGEMSFAVPLSFVEEIRRVPAGAVEEVGGKLLTKVREAVTEVVRLDSQLGLPKSEPVNGYCHLVLVTVAGRSVGVVVDEVIRKDEIVIKNLGEYLRNVKLFPGATIAPDGSLILLIDVNRLVAGDGLEALEIALQGQCDLIITDLEMPRTNGYELMMHLRQTPETKHIPVMVVTSRAGEKHRDRAIKEGASAFLTKPVQDEQLIA